MNSTKENILFNFFHEIVNLTNAMTRNSDILGLSVKGEKIDKVGVRHHVAVIQETLELIRFHISLVNLEINPEFFEFQQTNPVKLHSTFLRAGQIFKHRAKRNNVIIEFDKEIGIIPPIETHPIINISPFVIFDNCLKYSPTSTKIYVTFDESYNNLSVIVNSIGPKVEEEELEKLKILGYRGKRAIEEDYPGNGIGLYYLDKICQLCKAKLKIDSNQNSFMINGIDYSNFKVEIEIPKEYET